MMNSHLIRSIGFALTLCTSISAAESQSIDLVSRPAQMRPTSFGDSGDLQLSADGKWAVFASNGNGIVTNDFNGFNLDIFLRNNESGEITLITGDNSIPNGLADGISYAPQISADGQFIIFESEAANLVEGDENEASDVFLYDRAAGELSILTVDQEGNQLDATSGSAILSPDAQTILIETDAALSPLDENDSVDLYRFRRDGSIDLVTTKSNSLASASVDFPSSTTGIFDASMSADGRFIAFVSSSIDHVAGVPDAIGPQIYLRDMTTQTNVWLTRSTTGMPPAFVSDPVVSADGTFVLFLSSRLRSSDPVLPGESTFLYRYDIASGELERISAGTHAAGEIFTLSGDGNHVAFVNATNQLYLHQFDNGTNILVSQSATGEAASGVVGDLAISADGRFLLFTSTATNLVEGATNEFFQAYQYDAESGAVTLLSRSAVAGGAISADNDILFPVISADGSTAGFMSYASNLVTNDNRLSNDLFLVANNGTGEVTLASAPHPSSIGTTAAGSSYVEAQAISADGRFVIFTSDAPDLVLDDANSIRDLFIRDLQAGDTSLISRRPDGTQYQSSAGVTFVGMSFDASIIAYSVLELDGLTSRRDIYIYNRHSASNMLASILPSGDPAATTGVTKLTPDGRHLLFREGSALSSPLFIRDLANGTTGQYLPPENTSFGTEPVAISPNGRILLTRHLSSNYALHDLTGPTHLTNLASLTQLPAQPFTADGSMLLASTGFPSGLKLMLFSVNAAGTNILVATNATPVAVSPDGHTVAYLQRTNTTNWHLYFFDVPSNTSTPLLQNGEPMPMTSRVDASFSADNRYFVFVATNSVAGEDHSFNKILSYDTVLKTVRLVSAGSLGESAEVGAGNPSFSANGRIIVFDTFAANMVPRDLNLASDVFVTRFAPIDTDTDGLEDGWENLNFGGLATTADADSDNDGISNLHEFMAGSDPNNAGSTFTMQMAIDSGSEVITITAPASPGMLYELQFCADLSADEWETIGQPAVAFSNTVTFESTLNGDAAGFFRIIAAQ